MLTIEQELRVAMLAAPGITSLVGNRIYPDVAPENAVLPCVVYERDDSVPDENSFTLDGPGLYRTTITLSALGKVYESAHAVADALRAALENRTGSLTGDSPSQHVELILMRGFRDEGFQELPASYRFDLDVEIVHR